MTDKVLLALMAATIDGSDWIASCSQRPGMDGVDPTEGGAVELSPADVVNRAQELLSEVKKRVDQYGAMKQ